MGWNQPNKAEISSVEENKMLRRGHQVLVVFTVVLGLGFAGFWLFWNTRGKDADGSQRKNRTISEMSALQSNTNQLAYASGTNVLSRRALKTDTKLSQPEKIAQAKASRTNEAETDVVADFRPREGVKPLFRNDIHAELAEYLVIGRDIPPPKRITDEEAQKAFKEIITISEDDSEDDAMRKNAVIDMLGEMADYIRQGKHANDYLNDLYERQQLECEAVTTVRKNVRGLLKEGCVAEARAALKRYNAYLKTKGIPPIDVRVPKALRDEFYKEESK